jgi:PleD family two-component response regulator
MIGAGEPLDAALQRADEAMYRAKRDGRNQCQVALARA